MFMTITSGGSADLGRASGLNVVAGRSLVIRSTFGRA